MMININLEFAFLLFTICVDILLAYAVVRSNPKETANKIFGLLSLITLIWLILTYISRYAQAFGLDPLFWARFSIFFAVPQVVLIFLLTQFLPKKKSNIRRILIWSVYISAFAVMLLTLSPFIFKGVKVVGGATQVIPASGMIVFVFFNAVFSIIAIVSLLASIKSSNGMEKRQLVILLIGLLAMLGLLIATILVPVIIFQNSRAVVLIPIYVLLFLIMSAISVVRYHLFDIKLIATEALVAVLISVLLFEGVLSNSIFIIIYKLLFILLVGILGFFLIRSVKKETEQRAKLEKLTKELQLANTHLQELDKQKSEFLSIASHQLRTPLSIAKGYIELLQDGAYGAIDPEAKKILDSMNVSNENLIHLVGEFLNISRIEQGRESYDFKPCDLKSLVDETIEELCKNNSSVKHKINWHPACDGNIIADAEKIRNVVYNFIDNAIKYGESKSIDIKLDCDEKTTIFRVIDHGLGFGKEDKDSFFQKFYRGFNVRHTNINGVGLGLFACKKFIEFHKGKVWAKSDGVNRGSEFGFSIPLKSK